MWLHFGTKTCSPKDVENSNIYVLSGLYEAARAATEDHRHRFQIQPPHLYEGAEFKQRKKESGATLPDELEHLFRFYLALESQHPGGRFAHIHARPL